MFLSFIAYLQKEKRNFQKHKYESDMQYRAVLFRQFSKSYRWYCKSHQIEDEYEKVEYEIQAYEKRIQEYRNS